jgi:hypothetical protein
MNSLGLQELQIKYIRENVHTPSGQEKHVTLPVIWPPKVKGAGIYFGLIGVLASDYVAITYLEERPMDNPDSIPVAYKRFNSSSSPTSQQIKTLP